MIKILSTYIVVKYIVIYYSICFPKKTFYAMCKFMKEQMFSFVTRDTKNLPLLGWWKDIIVEGLKYGYFVEPGEILLNPENSIQLRKYFPIAI